MRKPGPGTEVARMRSMRKAVIFSLVFASVSMGSAAAQSPQKRAGRATATLAVVVSDPSGTPIGNVLVTVDGPDKRSARTEAGRIAFENLPTGAYRLRFEREGFVPLERELTARGGAPMDVKVTLSPMPEPPPPPAPVVPAAEKPAISAAPTALDLPSVIEKNFIGREPAKTSPLSCATDGSSSVIQVKEQLAQHAHDDADEFIYVIAGDGTARVSQRTEPVHAGMFLMIPRGVPHTFTATGKRPIMMLSTLAGQGCSAK